MAICQWERMVNNWAGRKWRQIFVQKIHTENSEKISIQSFPCYSSSEFLHIFFHSEIFFYFIFAHIFQSMKGTLFDHRFWFASSFLVSCTIFTCVGWSSTLKMEEADSSNTPIPVNHVTWRHILANLRWFVKESFILLLDKPNEYMQRGMDVKKQNRGMEWQGWYSPVWQDIHLLWPSLQLAAQVD